MARLKDGTTDSSPLMTVTSKGKGKKKSKTPKVKKDSKKNSKWFH